MFVDQLTAKAESAHSSNIVHYVYSRIKRDVTADPDATKLNSSFVYNVTEKTIEFICIGAARIEVLKAND